jgi:chromosome segregation ATPase
MQNTVNDYTKELNQLKSAIEKTKTERTKAETNKETLEKRREELLTECKALGVKPDDLAAEIERLDASIQDGLKQARELVPEEFLR